jgi:copper chaperone CopZ
VGTTLKGTIMRKSFKLENLDCANCAAKMEAGINELPGVNKACPSFDVQAWLRSIGIRQ